jgi:hypothetical protein
MVSKKRGNWISESTSLGNRTGESQGILQGQTGAVHDRNMTPSSGTCFHASITYLVTELAEVVDCGLVSELGADESVELMSEWDNTVVAGTLDVGCFA